MDINEHQQKINNYNQVRVDKEDDLLWIKNVISNLWFEGRITGEQCNETLKHMRLKKE